MTYRIDSRSGRAKLGHRRIAYWRVIEPGLAVGYYKPKSGTGAWWARVKKDDGAYRTTTLGAADDAADSGMTWAMAQTKAREWAAKRTHADPQTVQSAIESYAEDLRARKSDRAAKEVLGRMRKHLFPELGARKLEDLTTADLTKWRNGLVRSGEDEDAIRRSRDTANRMLAMVKAALNLAFETGRVADDKAWRRVKGFKGVGEARKVILNSIELQRLIDACDDGLRELVTAAALTGARLGELTSARVREFDLEVAILTVRGKTGERPIHLPPAAVQLLLAQATAKRPHDHLFTTVTGHPWTKSLHSRPFAAAVKRAELDPATVAYSLRHTWISHALKAGVPVKAVADHCGTSMTMLERYYAKFLPGDQQRYAAMGTPPLAIGRALETP